MIAGIVRNMSERQANAQHEIDAEFILTKIMHRKNYSYQVRDRLAEALGRVAEGHPLETAGRKRLANMRRER